MTIENWCIIGLSIAMGLQSIAILFILRQVDKLWHFHDHHADASLAALKCLTYNIEIGKIEKGKELHGSR